MGWFRLPGGQGVAQRLALDPVSHGYAAAIHVGQYAGGEEHPDDLELEVADSGGSGCAPVGATARCSGVEPALLVAACGSAQADSRAATAAGLRARTARWRGVTPPRSGWSTVAPAETALDDAPFSTGSPRRRRRPGVAGVMQRRRAAAVDHVDGVPRRAGYGRRRTRGRPRPGPGRVAPVEHVVQLRDAEGHLPCAVRRRPPGSGTGRSPGPPRSGIRVSSMPEGPDNLT